MILYGARVIDHEQEIDVLATRVPDPGRILFGDQ